MGEVIVNKGTDDVSKQTVTGGVVWRRLASAKPAAKKGLTTTHEKDGSEVIVNKGTDDVSKQTVTGGVVWRRLASAKPAAKKGPVHPRERRKRGDREQGHR